MLVVLAVDAAGQTALVRSTGGDGYLIVDLDTQEIDSSDDGGDIDLIDWLNGIGATAADSALQPDDIETVAELILNLDALAAVETRDDYKTLLFTIGPAIREVLVDDLNLLNPIAQPLLDAYRQLLDAVDTRLGASDIAPEYSQQLRDQADAIVNTLVTEPLSPDQLAAAAYQRAVVQQAAAYSTGRLEAEEYHRWYATNSGFDIIESSIESGHLSVVAPGGTPLFSAPEHLIDEIIGHAQGTMFLETLNQWQTGELEPTGVAARLGTAFLVEPEMENLRALPALTHAIQNGILGRFARLE